MANASPFPDFIGKGSLDRLLRKIVDILRKSSIIHKENRGTHEDSSLILSIRVLLSEKLPPLRQREYPIGGVFGWLI